jgi:hypothetical protein
MLGQIQLRSVAILVNQPRALSAPSSRRQERAKTEQEQGTDCDTPPAARGPGHRHPEHRAYKILDQRIRRHGESICAIACQEFRTLIK